MRELKYYKELPVRSVNKITYPIALAGADCYIDIQGNKFAFISFRNAGKPFFSLYLLLKQYNGSGSLIKESKFSIPSTYAKKGLFITPEPVPIEQECEGVEVYIQLAEFAGKTFYNDSWTRKGAESYLAAPKVTSTSFVPFTVQPTKDELLEAEAKGSVKVEEPVSAPVEEKVESVPTPVPTADEPAEHKSMDVASGSNFYSRGIEPDTPSVIPASEEKVEVIADGSSAEADPYIAPIKKLPPVTETKVYVYKNHIIYPIMVGVFFLLALTFVIVNYNWVASKIEELWLSTKLPIAPRLD